MKKLTLLMALFLMTTLGASADVWLIGNLSSYDWSATQGEQLTTTDNETYTITKAVTAGEYWYSFTDVLGSWSEVNTHRYGGDGGNLTVNVGTETQLYYGGENTIYTNFADNANYTFSLNTSTKKLLITKEETPVVDPTPDAMYLIGATFGWSPANPTPMTKNGDVFTYTGTFGGLFSFISVVGANNDDWGTVNAHRYGPTTSPTTVSVGTYPVDGRGDKNFNIAEGTYTLAFDYQAKTLTITQEGDEPTYPSVVYLRGTTNNWGATALQGNEGIFTTTFTLDGENAVQFKLALTENGWDYGSNWGDLTADKVGQELAVDGGSNFVIPAGQTGTWTVTFDYVNQTIKFDGTWVDVDLEKTYIKGTFNNWATVEMTKDATTGLYSFTQAMDAGVEFGFEDENGGWIGADADGDKFEVIRDYVVNGTELSLRAGNGKNFTIPQAGTWTFTLNRETMKLVISGEWPAPVVETKYYLAHNVANNGDWALEEMTDDGNGNYAITINETLIENTDETKTNFLFKVVKIEGSTKTWYGSNDELCADNLTLTLAAGDDNISLPAFTHGAWNFSFDPENLTLTLDGTWTYPVEHVYLYGVNDEWSTPVEMTVDDESGNFVLSVQITGEYGYFKVQKMIDYVDNQVWTFLGPESNGNFLITSEYANQWLPLSVEGVQMSDVQAFQVPAGDFTISVYNTFGLIMFEGEVTDPQSLAEILAENPEGADVIVSETLKVVNMDNSGVAYATDGNGNWIALDGQDLGKDYYKGLRGTYVKSNDMPMIQLTAAEVDAEASFEVEIKSYALDNGLGDDFSVSVGEVATFAGYYSAGTGCLSEWKNTQGQSLKLTNAEGIEDGAYVKLTVVLKKAESASGVARRAPADNKLAGYTGEVIEAPTPTAVDGIIADKAVSSVSYYNVAGARSSKPFEGMNIVVTRFNDGTVKTTKVVR